MNTLDEVIKAHELCIERIAEGKDNCPVECPSVHCCDPEGGALKQDALHYLKEWKEYQDTMQALPDYFEWVQNPPLTMEEFSGMIDTEPIWCPSLGEWYLFLAYDDGENRIQMRDDKGNIEEFDENDLENYPLYRRRE